MRLPFPVHISLWPIVSFAMALALVQMMQGTSIPFSICCFLFIIVTGVAFNVAGGFSRTTGGYVFFYAVLTVIAGVCWKVVLGEPADSNLLMPDLTMEVYLANACALLAAVFLSRRLMTREAILGKLVTDENMQNATIGCIITGFLLTFLTLAMPRESGSTLSALAQVNRFLPMAIILGVIHQIRKSGGTRSINIPVVISAVSLFGFGLVIFSKEAMFTPWVCWLVAAASQRYKINWYQIGGGVVAAIVMVYFLAPYSQYARNFQSESGSITENVQTAFRVLSDPNFIIEQDREQREEAHEAGGQGYYNTPQGFFDRLEMISVDDSLINVTEQGHVFGLYPLVFSFENLVPHFIWHDKPAIGFGNLYAHEIGHMIEEDTTTGISFSPTGESFHMARWIGVLLVAPVIWIVLFTLFDSLCGDTRRSPWGLLVIAVYSHVAPESMVCGVISVVGYTSISVILAAISSAYVMPLFGTLFVGPGRQRTVRSVAVRRVPRRLGRLSQAPETPPPVAR